MIDVIKKKEEIECVVHVADIRTFAELFHSDYTKFVFRASARATLFFDRRDTFC